MDMVMEGLLVVMEDEAVERGIEKRVCPSIQILFLLSNTVSVLLYFCSLNSDE